MPRRIAFLHTSPVHVETFERLTRTMASDVAIEHVVAEALLVDAQRTGAGDPALVARVHAAMTNAAANGAAIVVCTCSTIGGAAERTPTDGRFAVARIDRAMADRAVALGPRVLVVAALESTLAPTAALIRESAAAMHADVTLESLLVAEAWAHFTRGDRQAYIDAVAAAVRGAAAGHSVVVLAQASMAPAQDLLRDLGVEVLASPALGVERALAYLQGEST